MRRIEELLRGHIGLAAISIGASVIERTVRLRMKQCSLNKLDAYHSLLTSSRHELEQLIEAVVVTETWFFRDREPFNVFTQLVLQDWPSRHPGGSLRILSVPCASGEEPYSLAMALLDSGMADSPFAIDAVDISTNALARAGRAVYGKNSFRGGELTFRDRHFQPTKDGFTLNAVVRRNVKFQHGNLLADDFLEGSGPYDFIFCRNLLIYFDATAQVLALRRLHQLLAHDGLLFVGPAELPLVVASGFVNSGIPMAFACRKAAPARPQPSASRKPLPDPQVPAPTPAPAPPRTELEIARHHADAGRLTEAAEICAAQLANEGPSAQTFFLLGRIKAARNEPDAMACYRKALYLEPHHYEALVQLTRELEKSGDLEAARIYQRRAERAQLKS